ncbi:PREDICTED: protein CEPU-1-like [Chlamydotis macqueenii]|nr:PREDICTED: protein CEPU-1-like [Chlamydotis macqueenii]
MESGKDEESVHVQRVQEKAMPCLVIGFDVNTAEQDTDWIVQASTERKAKMPVGFRSGFRNNWDFLPAAPLVPRCYLEDGASKGAWLNRSSIIFAGSDKWSVDPRVSIATANRREYSLQIQDVDVTDDGPYTCSVQTQHTPRTMQVHLTVHVSPKIFRISSDIVVNEGSNVTLVCLATGKPEPSISWRHISPSAKPFESGQYLDIYGITRDQAGEYECSAENDVSVPDVRKVKVTVNFVQEYKAMRNSGDRSLWKFEALAVEAASCSAQLPWCEGTEGFAGPRFCRGDRGGWRLKYNCVACNLYENCMGIFYRLQFFETSALCLLADIVCIDVLQVAKPLVPSWRQKNGWLPSGEAERCKERCSPCRRLPRGRIARDGRDVGSLLTKGCRARDKTTG